MPKTNIIYNNTIIYKIVCNDLNIKDLYVGHTTDFTKRKYKHRLNCINFGEHHHLPSGQLSVAIASLFRT